MLSLLQFVSLKEPFDFWPNIHLPLYCCCLCACHHHVHSGADLCSSSLPALDHINNTIVDHTGTPSLTSPVPVGPHSSHSRLKFTTNILLLPTCSTFPTFSAPTMFGRSTSQRFDFTPASDTPGPGSYDVAASTLLHPNQHSNKKHPTFGDTKRWTDIEALITRSNPLLLLPPPTTTSDRKRVRESVAGGVAGVRRMTVSSQGKRHRTEDEEGGDGKKGDTSRERAEWEVERQKHAETQRELLKRLKEIKDDWDGEKSSLQQRIDQLQQQVDDKDAQIATTNETIATLTQHNDGRSQTTTHPTGHRHC